MIRITGVLLIFFSFAFAGMNMSGAMKKKLERLKSYRLMAEETATLIRYRGLTVREIILSLKENSTYSGLVFLNNAEYTDRSRSAGEIWTEAVEADFTLSSEEKELLAQFGSQLGTTDTEGQLSVIAVFKETLEGMIKRQSEKYAVKGKLCRSAGILAGAMAGILII